MSELDEVTDLEAYYRDCAAWGREPEREKFFQKITGSQATGRQAETLPENEIAAQVFLPNAARISDKLSAAVRAKEQERQRKIDIQRQEKAARMAEYEAQLREEAERQRQEAERAENARRFKEQEELERLIALEKADMKYMRPEIAGLPEPEQALRRYTGAEIKKVVALYAKVRISELDSDRRDRRIVEPRQLAMFLARGLTVRSLPSIGRMFGDRDHTTVLHAVRKLCAQNGIDHANSTAINEWCAAKMREMLDALQEQKA